MMRCVWRILHDADDADDAFQQATHQIWKRWQRIRRHANPRALVLRICINSACDVLRRREAHLRGRARGRGRKWEDLALHVEDLAATDPTPPQALLQQEQRQQILTAIAALSRHQALTVLMRLIHELPYDAIAAALGCSEATARVHYARGRKRLAGELAALAPIARKETDDDS